MDSADQPATPKPGRRLPQGLAKLRRCLNRQPAEGGRRKPRGSQLRQEAREQRRAAGRTRGLGPIFPRRTKVIFGIAFLGCLLLVFFRYGVPRHESRADFFTLVRRGDATGTGQLLARDPGLVGRLDEDGWTALHIAAAKGYDNLAKLLVEHDANANSRTPDGRRPLHCAINAGHDRVVQLLLDYGADPTAVDAVGDTPLHTAVSRGNLEIVKLLLAAKAGPGALNQQHVTPLHNAARSQGVDIARLLLEQGAYVEAKDVEGFTPLQVAAEEGGLEMVTLLLDAGARPGATNKAGQTALALAEAAGHAETAALLRSRTAN